MPIIHYRSATISPVETDRQFLCKIHSWLPTSSGLLITKCAPILLLENDSDGTKQIASSAFSLKSEMRDKKGAMPCLCTKLGPNLRECL